MHPTDEYVVLVDERNTVIGTMPKRDVHTGNTPLHRGFSIFLFNQKGELLLQQRSHEKKTWPLAWSNSCCGHPMPDEPNEDAARRRIDYELGASAQDIRMMLPYRYMFVKDGVMENEICPILVGRIDPDAIHINPDEVEDISWISWEGFLQEIADDKEKYSPWCREEALLLDADQQFKTFHAAITIEQTL